MKRRIGHNSPDVEDVFNINEYKLDNLESLISMIKDYEHKKLPRKKERVYFPSKIKLLPNILDDLIDLNNMIGMNTLKGQIVDQILFFIQGIDDKIMLHTVLEGPPGTGKTTVSHIMANIYAKLGIFKKVKFNIVKRSDLISEYLGGTATKTLETLERCKNGVMLIDEAYSLGAQAGQDDMYAKECIDTLNEYLSENVHKIICIIAGYKQQLNESFFSLNPGLKRRFPWTFTLEKYNSSELTKIFYKTVNEKEWDTDCDKDEIEKIIFPIIDLFDGNGGDINTIIEKCMIINTRNNFGKENLYTISMVDFKEAINIFIKNKSRNDTSPPFGMYN